MKTALTPESLHLLEQSLPWCTPLKGSSVQSRCTWWVGWASPASSPSGAWMLPRTCGKTAAGCHETRWPAHGRCCPETRPRSGWPAHPRLPHTKNSDSEDSCNMLVAPSRAVVWLYNFFASKFGWLLISYHPHSGDWKLYRCSFRRASTPVSAQALWCSHKQWH